MSTARDETRDGFYMEDGDPSVAQLLHERTFAFSFWPKVCGFYVVLLTKKEWGWRVNFDAVYELKTADFSHVLKSDMENPKEKSL